jgi:hypothetical protein
LVSVDDGGHPLAGVAWQGYVDWLGFPALSRADCGAARLQVRAAIEHAEAGALALGAIPSPTAPPPWRGCDFTLEMNGLGDISAQVRGISAFTCRRIRRRAASGRGWAMQPPVFSPLYVALTAPVPAALADWSGSTAPRTGRLHYASGIGLELTVEPESPSDRRQLALRVLRARWLDAR